MKIKPTTGQTKKAKGIFKKSLILSVILSTVVCCWMVSAESASITIGGDTSNTLEIIEMLTILALIPSILIMTTCFTRIIIVLSFLRNALGLQQTPPNQVLIGIALFLSLFIMSPVLSKINTDAYIPYQSGKITQKEFLDKASVPMKEFMLKNTKSDDLKMFVDLSGIKEVPKQTIDLPITTVIPAFMTSELKRAFLIGFLIYIPFLIIDLVVSSTLMSLGMIMLSPAMVSLPFKLLLFVLVNGWELLFKSLVTSFNI